MWKIRKLENDVRKVLRISGSIAADDLEELQKAVSSEATDHHKVELDLTDLKLVDRQVISFLVGCQAAGATLRNCPRYIREWIAREATAQDAQD